MQQISSSNSSKKSHIASRAFRDSEFINQTEIIKEFLKKKSFGSNISNFLINNEDSPKKNQNNLRSSALIKNYRQSSIFPGKEIINIQNSEKKNVIKVSDIEKYDENQILEVFFF